MSPRYYRIPAQATELEWDGERLFRMSNGTEGGRFRVPWTDQSVPPPRDAEILAAWELCCHRWIAELPPDWWDKELPELPLPGRYWFLPARVPCVGCGGSGVGAESALPGSVASSFGDADRLQEPCGRCNGNGRLNPHGLTRSEVWPEDDERLRIGGDGSYVEESLSRGRLEVQAFVDRMTDGAGIRVLDGAGRRDVRRS